MIDLEKAFGPLPQAEPAPGTQTSSEARSAGEPEPYGVHTVTAPSGIEIYFQAGPKRLYKLRSWNSGAAWMNEWREVPSVSDIKGILDKPGLPWWGMKVGVSGTQTLFNNYIDNTGMDDPGAWDTDRIVRWLTENKLTVNHVKNEAGDRGTSVHKALEKWAEPPYEFEIIPEDYPETERGYVQGLVNFLDDSAIQPVRSEVMVGSLEHGYAGRYDLDAYSVGNEVCVHLTKGGTKDRRAVIEPGLLRIDLKTSSNVYPDHYLQLAAYEQAAVECGYEKSDDRVVVNVWPDGRYQAKVSPAKFEHFKCCLDLYKALQELK